MPCNTVLYFAAQGAELARYRKVHLFSLFNEDQHVEAGQELVVADVHFAKAGFAVCYDLRFPHLYRRLAQAGADILTIPAAFTRVTGEAHWHVLVRARAIETGSFVIAPAQGGKHEDGRETFGHSLIISPWGDVLAEAEGAEPGIILADLDLDAVAKARGRIPSLGSDRDVPLTGV